MNSNSYNTEELLKLYSLCTEQLKYYNSLIWQFPTALATLNFVAYNFFKDKPEPLLILSILNFAMLYALFRHILNSKKIIGSTQKIELHLKDSFGEMIPVFDRPRIKATTVILITFLVLNLFIIIITLNMFKNG